MNYKTLSLIISFFGISLLLSAQDTILISENEVLEKVEKNNSSLKIANLNYKQAQVDFKLTNAVYLPNITASHTGIITTNPLMAFGSKLNQEILTEADFNPNLLNNPKRTQNFTTKIEVQQPILNFDGLYQRKVVKTKMEAQKLQTQRTHEYLIFEVKNAYMQLQLAYKGVDVLEKALISAKENLQLTDNRFKQGYLQRVDVLNAEVRVTEVKNQLRTAKSNIENASGYLSFLMNENQIILYQPSDNLQIKKLVANFNKVGNLSNNRSDVKAMQLASESYKKMYKAEKMSFLPRLNAFGSYELYGNKLFSTSSSGYLIGAQLKWDVFLGSKRFGKVQKSKVQYEKSKIEYQEYKAKSSLELNKTKRLLADVNEQLDLSKLALNQSEEALRIRKNRFKEGLEKISDLLMAETQYAQKQLEYYQAVYQHNYTRAYLDYLTKE